MVGRSGTNGILKGLFTSGLVFLSLIKVILTSVNNNKNITLAAAETAAMGSVIMITITIIAVTKSPM